MLIGLSIKKTNYGYIRQKIINAEDNLERGITLWRSKILKKV